MGDRELLEWAAKAAGVEVFEMGGVYLRKLPKSARGQQHVTGWNPLTDDGDALRLAVKLGMEVSAEHTDQMALAYAPGDVQGHAHDYSACNGDPCAAMRRAITRAAAEIGKATAPAGEGGAS